MSKQPHKNHHSTSHYRPPQSARTSRSATAASEPRAGLNRRLAVAAGIVALLLVVGLAVAGLTAAAVSGSHASGPPSGTQVFAENDHSHVAGPVQYDRVPPAGGAHNATQLNCGVYTTTVPNENAVHSLEHGAVWITYQPNLPPDQLAQLQSLVTSSYVGTERYIILSPYVGLPSPVVASAWGAQLTLPSVSDSRLPAFIHFYAGGGQGGEQGGPCTGGVGNPVE